MNSSTCVISVKQDAPGCKVIVLDDGFQNLTENTNIYANIFNMGSHESCYYSDDVFKKRNLYVSDASLSVKYI